MSQILLRPDQIQGELFHLGGKEAHHLIRVLRKKKGDEVSFFDGQGGQYDGVITEVDAVQCLVHGRLIAHTTVKKGTRLRLFQGLPKGSKIDYVIEKATELGADEIVPFLSEKSLIRLDGKQAAAKQERWSRLAQAAAKQCDRVDIPVVCLPRHLRDLESDLKEGFTLVLSMQKDSRPFGSAIPKGESLVNLVVGPESGFSASELDWLLTLSAQPVSLGKLTLRTETAGLAALTLVNHELGLL